MSRAAADVPVTALEMGQGALLYAVKGEGVPVVAVHGLPGSVRDFRKLGEATPGVRMIRLNMPGFAGSAPQRRPGDWDELVTTIAEAAQRLAGGPFVMLGHSVGGMVSLRAAARTRECRGLALMASAGLRPHRALRKLACPYTLRSIKPVALSRAVFLRAMASSPIGKHARGTDAESAFELLRSLDFAPSKQAARELRVPVLFANCLDDPTIEPEVSEELAAALNTTKRMVYERGGHSPQRDYATELGAALAEFARACVLGGAPAQEASDRA